MQFNKGNFKLRQICLTLLTVVSLLLTMVPATFAIEFGETISGYIGEMEIDCYEFIANAGDRVIVRMLVTSGNLDPQIALYDENDNELCENHSYGSTAQCYGIPLANPGTYTIRVDDYGNSDTGNYKLYLECRNCTTPVECTSHKDCDDGNVCSDDICSDGECVYTNNTNPCDDRIYCNGADICSDGNCSNHSGNPCSDDGLFCNGDESCDEENDMCVSSGDPCSEDTICNENTDSCEPPPGCSADFIASPLFGCADLEVHFTGLCEGNVLSYLWDFGDGETSTEPNPTHTYHMGIYSPCLTCTCSDGSDIECKKSLIWVIPYCPLVCSLDNEEQINGLRRFRDYSLSKNIFGLVLVYLYYQNATEVSEILYENPNLKKRLRDLVSEHINIVDDVIKGRKVFLSESEVTDIIDFANDLKTEGSPNLRSDINLVIEALQEGYLLHGLGVSVE